MSKTCNAKVTVIHPFTQFGGEADYQLVLPCCLMAPHPANKHYNPRLLLTVGGDRIQKDAKGKDITKNWSPFIEAKEGK